MPDGTEIEITLKADASGAIPPINATSAAVDKLKVSTAGLNGEMAGTASEVGQKALSELGHDAEKTEPLIEKLGISNKALRAILHLIGHEAGPAAGAAVAALGAAGGGGIMMAVMAAKELFEWLHNIKDASSDALSDNLAKSIKALSDAVAAGNGEIAQYANNIERIAKAEMTAAQAMASQLDLMKAIAAEREKAIKAQEAAAAAQRAEDEAAHVITPNQKMARDIAAKEQEAKDEFARKKTQAAAEITAKQKEVDKAAANQPALDAAAKEAEKKDAAAKGKLDALNKEFEGKSYTERMKMVQDAEKNTKGLKENQRFFSVVGQALIPDIAPFMRGPIQRGIEGSERREELIKQQEKAYDQSVLSGALPNKVAKEDAAAKAAEKAGTDNAQTVKDAQREINEATKQLQATAKADRDEFDASLAKIISEGMAQVLKTNTGDVLKGVEPGAEKVLAGRGSEIDSSAQNTMIELGALISGHPITFNEAGLNEAARFIHNANQNDQAFLDAFKMAADNSEMMFRVGGRFLQQLQQANADIASLRDRLEAYHAQSRETATSGSR